MTFRFGIFAAVSSDEQVDKASLSSQVELSRAAGLQLGGVESTDPFIVDGYSRSGYYDLTEAMHDIPPLRACLESIRQYDVLIMKNFDRLGDLGKAIYNYCARYKKQLHAVEQATPIYPPDEYNPHRHTAVALMIATMSIPQVYRIAKIADAFATGNPRRARDGKYGTHVPYGYIKIDKSTVHIDETIAPLLIKFKDWFLSGVSLSKIVIRANQTNIPPRAADRWYYNAVLYILKNPFYAGKTFYARGYKNERGWYYLRKTNIELHDGKHEPLWTYDEYQKIMAEFDRRSQLRTVPADYNFTGLLKCAICGKALHITHARGKLYWWCNGHVTLRKGDAEQQVGDELVRLFAEKEYHPTEGEQKSRVQKSLAAVENQLRREEKAWDAGAYTPEEYAEKRKSLNARRAELLDEKKQEEEEARRVLERERIVKSMAEILPRIHEWLAAEDPQVVKFHLSQAIRLTAHPDKTIQAEFL